MKDFRKLFEISWEVCNQNGGIYTVIRSKMPSVTEYFGQNYYAIGPFTSKSRGEFEYEDLPDDAVGEVIREMWAEGFDIHYGTWLNLALSFLTTQVKILPILNTTYGEKQVWILEVYLHWPMTWYHLDMRYMYSLKN